MHHACGRCLEVGFLLVALLSFEGSLYVALGQDAHRFTLERQKQEGFTLGGLATPHWSGGAILAIDGNRSDEPLIHRFGRDGEFERIRFSIPEGRHITVQGLAGATDGSVAVIGSMYKNDGGGTTFLARIQPDRQRQIVTHLWPYVPKVVTFAPDGTIWTIGWVRSGDTISAWNVLKRFDPSGKLLESAPVRAKPHVVDGDNPDNPRDRDASSLSALRASGDRVVWLTSGNELIEFTLDGREVGRYDGPDCADSRTMSRLALRDDNEVIAHFPKCKPDSRLLDRTNRSWIPFELTTDKDAEWDVPLGFDEGTLVTSSQTGMVRRYKLATVQ
jgi:hypothetical protein